MNPGQRTSGRLGRACARLSGAQMEAGEGRIVLLFFANSFCLLAAYYILKVVREPLILVHGTAVSRSYARGLQALLLLAIVPVYSSLANRMEPARLVHRLTLSFAACLVLFCALGLWGVPLGFVFFVWLGIFGTLATAQFWSLTNDVLSEQQGRRLFPLIAVGGTLGGIAGAQIAARGIAWLGTYLLMVLSALLLCGCTLLARAAHRAALRARPRAPRLRPRARDTRGGFAIALSDPYLLLIGACVLLLNAVNTTGEFILADQVDARATLAAADAADPAAARATLIGSFYGDFQTLVTVLAGLLQVLLVGRLFRTLGVPGSLLLLPLIATAGYGASAIFPVLAIVALVKVVENSGDYSLQSTLHQALFLPTSRDAKYKAKAAIDTFLVRTGDLASAGLVFVGVQMGLGIRGFALVNAVIGAVWVGLATRLAVRYRRRVRASERRVMQPAWRSAPVLVSQRRFDPLLIALRAHAEPTTRARQPDGDD